MATPKVTDLNPVDEAIRILDDSPTEASHVARMSVAAIYKWRKIGYVPDSKAAVRLAMATGIPAWKLAGLTSEPRPEGESTTQGNTRRLVAGGSRRERATYRSLQTPTTEPGSIPPAAIAA